MFGWANVLCLSPLMATGLGRSKSERIEASTKGGIPDHGGLQALDENDFERMVF
jgi:hypothetical protein